MATTKKTTTTKKAPKLTAEAVMTMYMEYVLEHAQRPASVFKFCKEHNISYLDQKNNGFASPIIKLICEHKLPLRYGDFATIETTYIDSPAVKMIFEYKIIRLILR